jgi:hypothetical protein
MFHTILTLRFLFAQTLSLSLARSLCFCVPESAWLELFGSELDLGKQAVHPVHDVNTYAYQFSYGKRDLKNKK